MNGEIVIKQTKGLDSDSICDQEFKIYCDAINVFKVVFHLRYLGKFYYCD